MSNYSMKHNLVFVFSLVLLSFFSVHLMAGPSSSRRILFPATTESRVRGRLMGVRRNLLRAIRFKRRKLVDQAVASLQAMIEKAETLDHFFSHLKLVFRSVTMAWNDNFSDELDWIEVFNWHSIEKLFKTACEKKHHFTLEHAAQIEKWNKELKDSLAKERKEVEKKESIKKEKEETKVAQKPLQKEVTKKIEPNKLS